MRAPVLTTLMLTVAAVLLAALPTAAQGNWQPGDTGSARVRLGLFMPDGDSQYWDDAEQAFTGSIDDFEDISVGFDYLWRVNPYSGLLLTTEGYEGETTRAYRDWLDQDGREVRHRNRLETVDLTAAWILQLPADRSPVRPYFGLGGGLLFWELSESGSFIDFGDPDLPIVRTTYVDQGTTLQGLALAGLEVGMSRSFSFLVEGRYRYADDELGGDFDEAGTLDLSGFSASAGFAWNF